MRQQVRWFKRWLLTLLLGATACGYLEGAMICTGCGRYWSVLGDFYWMPRALLEVFLLVMLLKLVVHVVALRRRNSRAGAEKDSV